jgi:Zn-dependent protease with chaperone function
MTKLPACLGIPVAFDETFLGISDSRGFLAWKKIVVGPAWLALTEREKGAVLLHEVGHARLLHAEKRFFPALWMHLRYPLKVLAILRAATAAKAASLWDELLEDSGFSALARRQEFEADSFAAGCGYGRDLAMVFTRTKAEFSPLHPPISERIERLATAGSAWGV